MNDEPKSYGGESQPVDDEQIVAEGPRDLEEVAAGFQRPVGCATLIHILAAAFLILALYLEWITPPLGIALLVVYIVGVWLIRRTIRRMFEAPFAMKARALEGAISEIHSVKRLDHAPPDAAAFEDDGGEDLAYYEIEATITPKAPSEGFVSWEPGEICLIDSAKSIASIYDVEGEHPVFNLEIEAEGAFTEDEGFKLQGPQKLRFTVGLPPDLRRAKFLYYTQTFGDVQLPTD